MSSASDPRGGWLADEFTRADEMYEALPPWAQPVVTKSPADGATVRHVDPRIPDPPADLIAALDPGTRAIAAAYWRIGYATCLDTPRTWRDSIPAGVRILDDRDYHSNREG